MWPDFQIANLALNLTAGDWVDIVCLGLLVVHAIIGGMLRFSGILASLTSILIALQSGYWLFPTVDYHLRRVAFVARHPTLGTLAIYLVVVALGLALYFLLRVLLKRLFSLFVELPFDRFFGMLVGLGVGLILLFSIFSATSLLPEKNSFRQALLVKSRTGAIAKPAISAIFEKRPHATTPIQSKLGRLPARKTPDRKPAPPAPASPRPKRNKR